MSDTINDTNRDAVLRKIEGLLANARSLSDLGNTEAAEAYASGAAKLMLKHAIDEAMLGGMSYADANAITHISFPIKRDSLYQGKRELLHAICLGNRCKAIFKYGDTGADVFGTVGDTAFVEGMYQVLAVEMICIYLDEVAEQYAGKPGRKPGNAYRADWCKGFAIRIKERMMEQRTVQRQTIAEAGGAALVLLDADKRAEQAARDMYPDTTTRGAARLSGAGAAAGYKAGDRANTGAGAMGVGRRALNA